MRFNAEQLRIVENLRGAYASYREALRADARCGLRLVWKNSKGSDYLYEMSNVTDSGRSLGPRSAQTQARFEAFEACRADAAGRLRESTESLATLARLYRALDLPRIDPRVGEILRQFDVDGLLGAALMVVGTNTMAAYEIEAQSRFASSLDATNDADFAWRAHSTQLAVAAPPGPIMQSLRAVDRRFTVNSEKPFQALNAKGYEVEVLIAPSIGPHYPQSERLRPVALPEQEWLLLGEPVDVVVLDLGGLPARIVAPDPRWMALHKAWLAEQPKRNRNKIEKDRQQSVRLAEAVMDFMPHYRVNAAFMASVPHELLRYAEALFARALRG